MVPFDYKLLLLRLMPEMIVVLGGILVLFLEQALSRSSDARQRSYILSLLSAGTVVLSIVWIGNQSPSEGWLNGMWTLSPLNGVVKQLVLVLGIFTLLVSPSDRFTRHVGEYYALILFGLVGMMAMVSTEELLVAFIGLETASLTLYILTAFNKHNINSAEAALKYFLFGSVSAAFTLFGISLLFGVSGSTSFEAIGTALNSPKMDSLLMVALSMMLIGFGFKIAAVPLHLWAPDAYQGAPIPSVALIASGSKLASFYLLAKVLIVALPTQGGGAAFRDFVSGWMPVLAVLALASLVFGNIVAIAQSNLRRLLAYSAIAHAGYTLLGVIAGSEEGTNAVVYYMFTYGLAVIGVFGVIGVVEREHGQAQLEDLAGLSRRAPLLSGCLMVFVLSLAGMPPLAGFFGKFYVFFAALKSTAVRELGLLWLVIVAIAASAVSLYYYLQILKQAYVKPADPECEPLAIDWPQQAVLAVLAAAVLLFGCLPNLLLNRF